MYTPDYPFDGEPAPGETVEVAPGVLWLRMPLPFKLNHINLWLLDDGDGWAIVDTGVARDDIIAAWQAIEDRHFRNKPPSRVIVTHYHPDHVGLAGWLCERYGVGLSMTLGEWTQARLSSLETADSRGPGYREFYRAAGFDDQMLALVDGRAGHYGRLVSPVPGAYRRLFEGDEINIGGRAWRVIVGLGHAIEHACLHCDELGVLISGDQILPKITPNVSVAPQEPDADPLGLFLAGLTKFEGLADDTLVLPSHNWPFRRLAERLADMRLHHEERLEATMAVCAQPATGVEILKHLFTRELDNHQIFFAIGESLAHAHHLVATGRAERTTGDDGTLRFRALD